MESATASSSSSRPLPQPQLQPGASSQLNLTSHASGAGWGHVDASDFHTAADGHAAGHDEPQGPRHSSLAAMLSPFQTTELAARGSLESYTAALASGGVSGTSQPPDASGSAIKRSSSTHNINGDARGLPRPVLLGGPGDSSPLRPRFTEPARWAHLGESLRPQLSSGGDELRAAASAAPAASPVADRLGAPVGWSGASTTGGTGASLHSTQQRGEAAAAWSPMKAATAAPADHPPSPQQQLLQRLLSPSGGSSVIRRQPSAVAADVLSMLAEPADPEEEEEGSRASAFGSGRGQHEGSLTSSPCLSVASSQIQRRLSVEGVVRAALGFTDDETWGDDSPPASPSRLATDPPAPPRDTAAALAAASPSSPALAAAPAATDARVPAFRHIGSTTSSDVPQDGRRAIAPQEPHKPPELSKPGEERPGGASAGWLQALLSPITWSRQSPGTPTTGAATAAAAAASEAGAAAAAPAAGTAVNQAGGEARGSHADPAEAAPQSPLRRRVSFNEPEKADAQPRRRPSFTSPGPMGGLHPLNLSQGAAAPPTGSGAPAATAAAADPRSAAASAGLHTSTCPPPTLGAAVVTAAVSVPDGDLAVDASDGEGGGWSTPGRLSITTVALDASSQPAASADAAPPVKPNSELAMSSFSFPVPGAESDQHQRHAPPANKRPEPLAAWQGHAAAAAAMQAARSPRSPSPTRPVTNAPLPQAPAAAAAASPGHPGGLMRLSGGGAGGGGVGVGLQMLLPVMEWSRLRSGTILGRTVPSPPDSPVRSISPAAAARPSAPSALKFSAAGSVPGSPDRQRYGSPPGAGGRVPGGAGLRSSGERKQTDPWVTTLADRCSNGSGSSRESPSHRVRSASPPARAVRLGTAAAGAHPAAAPGSAVAASMSPPGSPVRRPGGSAGHARQAGHAWPAGRASPPMPPPRPPSPPPSLGSNGGLQQGVQAASTSPRVSEPGTSGGGRYSPGAGLGYAALAQRRREGGRYSRSSSPGPSSPPVPKPAAAVSAVLPPGGKQQRQRSPGQTQAQTQRGPQEHRAAVQQDVLLESLQQPSFSFFVVDDAGLHSRQQPQQQQQQQEWRSPTSAGLSSGSSRRAELAGSYPGGHKTLRVGVASVSPGGSPVASPGSGPTRGGGAGRRYSSPSSPKRLGLEALALSGGAKGRRADAFSCDGSGGGGSSGGSLSRSPVHKPMGLSEFARATQPLDDLAKAKQVQSMGAGGGDGFGGGDAGLSSSGWIAAGASPSRSPVSGAAQPATSPSLRLGPSASIDMEDAVLLHQLADSRLRRSAGAARPTTSPSPRLSPTSTTGIDAEDAALLRQPADSRLRPFTGGAALPAPASALRSGPAPSPSIDAEDAFLLHQIANSRLQPFPGAAWPVTSLSHQLGPSGSIDAEDAALLRQLADIQRDVERIIPVAARRRAPAAAARLATASAARPRLHGPSSGGGLGLEPRPWTAQQPSVASPRRHFSWSSSAAGTNTAAAAVTAATADAADPPSLASTLRRMSRPGTASADVRAARPRATSPPPRVAEMAVAMAAAAASVAARYCSSGGGSAAAGLRTMVAPALLTRPPPRIEPLTLPQRRRSASSPGSPRLPTAAADVRREQQLLQLHQQQLQQQREAELSRPVGAWAVLPGPVEAPTTNLAGLGVAGGASSARDYARDYAFYVGAEAPTDGRSRSTPHSYGDARRGGRHGRYGARASSGGAAVAAVSLAGSLADEARSSRSVSAGGSLCIYSARSPSRMRHHEQLVHGALRTSGGAAAAATTALTGASAARMRSRSAGSAGGGSSQGRQGRYGAAAAAAAGGSTGGAVAAAMAGITLRRPLSVLDLAAVTRGLRRSASQGGQRPSTPTSPVASPSVVRTLWKSPAAAPTPTASDGASARALFQQPNWREQRQPSTPGVAKLSAFSTGFPAPHHADPWDAPRHAVTLIAAPSPVTGLMQGAPRAAAAAAASPGPNPSPPSLSPRPRPGSRSPTGARPASPLASSSRVLPAHPLRAEASGSAAATAGATGGALSRPTAGSAEGGGGRYFAPASSSSARQGSSPARARTIPAASSRGTPPEQPQRASSPLQTRPMPVPASKAVAAGAGSHPSLPSKPNPPSTGGSRRQAGPANTQPAAGTQTQSQTRPLAALLPLATPHQTPVAASGPASASGSRRASATAGPASSGAATGGHRSQALDLVLQGLTAGPNNAAHAELSHSLLARKKPHAASAGGGLSAGGGGSAAAAAATAAAASGRRMISLLTTADVLPYSGEHAAARLNSAAAAAAAAGSAAPSASPGTQAREGVLRSAGHRKLPPTAAEVGGSGAAGGAGAERGRSRAHHQPDPSLLRVLQLLRSSGTTCGGAGCGAGEGSSSAEGGGGSGHLRGAGEHLRSSGGCSTVSIAGGIVGERQPAVREVDDSGITGTGGHSSRGGGGGAAGAMSASGGSRAGGGRRYGGGGDAAGADAVRPRRSPQACGGSGAKAPARLEPALQQQHRHQQQRQLGDFGWCRSADRASGSDRNGDAAVSGAARAATRATSPTQPGPVLPAATPAGRARAAALSSSARASSVANEIGWIRMEADGGAPRGGGGDSTSRPCGGVSPACGLEPTAPTTARSASMVAASPSWTLPYTTARSCAASPDPLRRAAAEAEGTAEEPAELSLPLPPSPLPRSQSPGGPVPDPASGCSSASGECRSERGGAAAASPPASSAAQAGEGGAAQLCAGRGGVCHGHAGGGAGDGGGGGAVVAADSGTGASLVDVWSRLGRWGHAPGCTAAALAAAEVADAAGLAGAEVGVTAAVVRPIVASPGGVELVDMDGHTDGAGSSGGGAVLVCCDVTLLSPGSSVATSAKTTARSACGDCEPASGAPAAVQEGAAAVAEGRERGDREPHGPAADKPTASMSDAGEDIRLPLMPGCELAWRLLFAASPPKRAAAEAEVAAAADSFPPDSHGRGGNAASFRPPLAARSPKSPFALDRVVPRVEGSAEGVQPKGGPRAAAPRPAILPVVAAAAAPTAFSRPALVSKLLPPPAAAPALTAWPGVDTDQVLLPKEGEYSVKGSGGSSPGESSTGTGSASGRGGSSSGAAVTIQQEGLGIASGTGSSPAAAAVLPEVEATPPMRPGAARLGRLRAYGASLQDWDPVACSAAAATAATAAATAAAEVVDAGTVGACSRAAGDSGRDNGAVGGGGGKDGPSGGGCSGSVPELVGGEISGTGAAVQGRLTHGPLSSPSPLPSSSSPGLSSETSQEHLATWMRTPPAHQRPLLTGTGGAAAQSTHQHQHQAGEMLQQQQRREQGRRRQQQGQPSPDGAPPSGSSDSPSGSEAGAEVALGFGYFGQLERPAAAGPGAGCSCGNTERGRGGDGGGGGPSGSGDGGNGGGGECGEHSAAAAATAGDWPRAAAAAATVVDPHPHQHLGSDHGLGRRVGRADGGRPETQPQPQPPSYTPESPELWKRQQHGTRDAAGSTTAVSGGDAAHTRLPDSAAAAAAAAAGGTSPPAPPAAAEAPPPLSPAPLHIAGNAAAPASAPTPTPAAEPPSAGRAVPVPVPLALLPWLHAHRDRRPEEDTVRTVETTDSSRLPSGASPATATTSGDRCHSAGEAAAGGGRGGSGGDARRQGEEGAERGDVDPEEPEQDVSPDLHRRANRRVDLIAAQLSFPDFPNSSELGPARGRADAEVAAAAATGGAAHHRLAAETEPAAAAVRGAAALTPVLTGAAGGRAGAAAPTAASPPPSNVQCGPKVVTAATAAGQLATGAGVTPPPRTNPLHAAAAALQPGPAASGLSFTPGGWATPLQPAVPPPMAAALAPMAPGDHAATPAPGGSLLIASAGRPSAGPSGLSGARVGTGSGAPLRYAALQDSSESPPRRRRGLGAGAADRRPDSSGSGSSAATSTESRSSLACSDEAEVGGEEEEDEGRRGELDLQRSRPGHNASAVEERGHMAGRHAAAARAAMAAAAPPATATAAAPSATCNPAATAAAPAPPNAGPASAATAAGAHRPLQGHEQLCWQQQQQQQRRRQWQLAGNRGQCPSGEAALAQRTDQPWEQHSHSHGHPADPTGHGNPWEQHSDQQRQQWQLQAQVHAGQQPPEGAVQAAAAVGGSRLPPTGAAARPLAGQAVTAAQQRAAAHAGSTSQLPQPAPAAPGGGWPQPLPPQPQTQLHAHPAAPLQPPPPQAHRQHAQPWLGSIIAEPLQQPTQRRQLPHQPPHPQPLPPQPPLQQHTQRPLAARGLANPAPAPALAHSGAPPVQPAPAAPPPLLHSAPATAAAASAAPYLQRAATVAAAAATQPAHRAAAASPATAVVAPPRLSSTLLAPSSSAPAARVGPPRLSSTLVGPIALVDAASFGAGTRDRGRADDGNTLHGVAKQGTAAARGTGHGAGLLAAVGPRGQEQGQEQGQVRPQEDGASRAPTRAARPVAWRPEEGLPGRGRAAAGRLGKEDLWQGSGQPEGVIHGAATGGAQQQRLWQQPAVAVGPGRVAGVSGVHGVLAAVGGAAAAAPPPPRMGVFAAATAAAARSHGGGGQAGFRQSEPQPRPAVRRATSSVLMESLRQLNSATQSTCARMMKELYTQEPGRP
ncbi:hypothetical protein PLESTB_001464400 [Pleodorina starrii]|uniref:Uncharacterized protein n=1 Tax=Pleodorina starrii TaxID=330485 RepID=A0A9W6BWU3_9CHLO|nr:hypothetical protein PLESTB_001464400 [Pleodorina starrii]